MCIFIQIVLSLKFTLSVTNSSPFIFHFIRIISMNVSRIFSALAFVCLLGLTLSSCTDPGTGGGRTVVIPDAVSNLQATSVDAGTVRLRWTGSSAATVTGYRIITVSTTGSVVRTQTTLNTSLDVDSLTAGRIYTFKVQTRTNDTVSAERTITWSPATRIRMAVSASGKVLLYESASTFGSGLSFQGGVAQNRQIVDAARWDIGLDTRANSAGQISFDIGSPNMTSYSAFANNGGRKTIVSSSVYSTIDSLNQVFDTQLNIGTVEQLITFTNANRGFVFACRTQDGNYAKVFVKANAGVLLQGISPDRYVEVEISYQPVANVPFAYQLDKAASAVLNQDIDGSGVYFVKKKVSSEKD
jgi:hypothetical protein